MNRVQLLNIFNTALSAVDPYQNVLRALRLENNSFFAAGNTYPLGAIGRVIVVGAGKASARMAAAAEEAIGELVNEGIVIGTQGQTASLRKIQLLEAAHPVPDQAGFDATRRVLELVRKADEKTLVICLLSGGGSALMVAPAAPLSLADKQETTGLLLKSGCTIDELNTVRKHLSAVKGGRLAQAAYPASVISLILSDVIGDNLNVIASGPTVADDTTFADAVAVVDRYRLRRELPDTVITFLERGSAGNEQETAKSGDACFRKTANAIIGSIAQALGAAGSRAKALGYEPTLVSSELQGPARDAGRMLSQKALAIRDRLKAGERRCLLSGGETTVFVKGSGMGGRNQELALSFATGVAGVPGIFLLSAGTDGRDGPTDAAGAIVDGETVLRARQAGISPEAFLENNDSYNFFKKIDTDAAHQAKHHVHTGPTGTNVMDLQIVLLEG